MTTPDWLQDAIFYQIFPDRFNSGDPGTNPANVQPWGALPTLHGFQGGDLRGIQQRLDYLLDLGVNAIYLNPIFLSPSNHRYNTTDYYTIDPRLGSLKDFHHLVEAAHARHMRVVLDGVFNHCSRGFFAFTDVLENGIYSAYQDWFHIKKFPLNAYQPGKARNYAAWWEYKSMPKLNTGNPAVRRYIMDVARYWIEQGADGWRLDVPNEIDDDDFWAEFRQVVRSANPQACLIGEIWITDRRWVGEGHFDGLMNYPLRAAILGLLMKPGTPHSGAQIKPLSISGFARQVESLLKLYPRENVYGMYNLLGSHDTERLSTLFANDLDKLKLAYSLLFALPGAPSVYYGDEIGVTGGRDPDCRAAFPWDTLEAATPDTLPGALRAWLHKLIDLRKRLIALRRGETQRLYLDRKAGCYAFARSLGEEMIIVALNAGSKTQMVSIPLGADSEAPAHPWHDLLGGTAVQPDDQALQLRLPPRGIAWIGAAPR